MKKQFIHPCRVLSQMRSSRAWLHQGSAPIVLIATRSRLHSMLASPADLPPPRRVRNPVFPVWSRILRDNFGKEYWIYPTYSAPYDQQTHFDAFSSPDLVTWTKHSGSWTRNSITWARGRCGHQRLSKRRAVFPVFCATTFRTISSAGDRGGGGDKPAGPFRDHLGKPLIDRFHNGAQPIDQFVFRDKDGTYYMIYGGWRHCNIAKLKPDFTGSFRLKTARCSRDHAQDTSRTVHVFEGREILFHVVGGGWTGPNYSVAYAIADSPQGPFQRMARFCSRIARLRPGGASFGDPRSEQRRLVYRLPSRPLGETDANHRVTCIDRMQFDAKERSCR